jgi:hypothetical protein
MMGKKHNVKCDQQFEAELHTYFIQVNLRIEFRKLRYVLIAIICHDCQDNILFELFSFKELVLDIISWVLCGEI